MLAAIALVLGPDTAYHKRLSAVQRLVQLLPELLPVLLHTLQEYPEIDTPAWPWWPPQYEHLSRLLLRLSLYHRLSLTALLSYPCAEQTPGPVLWTSVVEAMGRLPHMEYELVLCEALQAPWRTVRYAAAQAIANRAAFTSLGSETHQALRVLLYSDDEASVRLVAASTLLRCADESGLLVLMDFLAPAVEQKYCRAALFLLATELPPSLRPDLKHRLAALVLPLLQLEDQQMALHAARVLRIVATPALLPALYPLLENAGSHTCLAVLIALEEIASRKTMRHAIQQQMLLQHIITLLQREEPAIRRQACYTLATVGGEYAMAVLGTTLLDVQHPAHLDAIEALRLLPDIWYPPTLTRIVRWLAYILVQPPELLQICALETLGYLVRQAAYRRWRAALHLITEEMEQSGAIFQLLASASARVRQQSVELLALLDAQIERQSPTLLEMLHHDIESSVRACIARILGQTAALWALPDLLQALMDWDETVAEVALNALDRLSVADDALLVYAFQEVSAYHIPLWALEGRYHLLRSARTLLKKRQERKSLVPERKRSLP